MPDTDARPHEDSSVRSAFAQGRAIGIELTSRGLQAQCARSGPQGLIVAAGDSWFDYSGGDLLSSLRDLGYDVEAAAHSADTLEEMAFSPRHLTDFHRVLARVKASGRVPRAILLSGGAQDLVGEDFGTLINHAGSGVPTLDPTVFGGIVDGRLKIALSRWIGTTDAVARAVFGAPLKIVVHGYDYPVPDGRAFTFGPVRLRGPWLRPGFWLKGHNNLQRNRGVIREVIDRFNEMQESLIAELALPNLVHVDLRNTLSSVLYENDWENELHPTDMGFRSLARKIGASV
jgi:hypothetical protein